jgi:hypothetical protein
VTTSGSLAPAGSVSFASTLPLTGVACGVMAESLFAVGATLFTLSVNVVVATPPCPSSAVMVTVCVASSSPVALLHAHVPSLVPDLVTVPSDAVTVTLSPSMSLNRPEFVAVVPSLTTRLPLPSPFIPSPSQASP